MPKQLAIVIHHLNPWGGQDRSTLEIARRLSHRFNTHLFSYELVDPEMKNWGSYTFHKITPNFRKPVLFTTLWFYIKTFIQIQKQQKNLIIHSTGACSLVSDIIQVQFTQAAWKKAQVQFNKSHYKNPRTRSAFFLKRWILNFYHRLLLNLQTYFEAKIFSPHKSYIAIAQGVASELQENFGIERKNIHVIHHGVDSQKFKPSSDIKSQEDRRNLRQNFGVSSSELVIAFVGEYERKGLAVALEAMSMLSQDMKSKLKLLAIGQGDHKGFYIKACKLQIQNQVCFLKHQNEIEKFYQASDIFLLPTLYEPFGLVILEAMSSGLACIVSKKAGAAELIADGVHGKLLQNPENPKEAAEILAELVQNDEKRKRMGQKAREVALSRSWDQVASEYAGVISQYI